MDTALVRPPSPTYTAITPVTRAPDKEKPAASTDLPAEDTVRPAGDSSETQRSANNGQNRVQGDHADQSALERFSPAVTRQNVIDPESDSLVFVATDTETGEVIRQIPSETLLRLRAYSEAVEAHRNQIDALQTQSDPASVQRTA